MKIFIYYSAMLFVVIGVWGIPSSRSYPKDVKSFTKINQTIHTDVQTDKLCSIHTITNEPLFHIVNYFTKNTEETEVKVHDLALPHDIYYTHMYLAWLKADKFMSSIALNATKIGDELCGASMVMSIENVGQMYAPDLLAPVLDFLTKCYYWARPKILPNVMSKGYISTLRVSANPAINRRLIDYTTKQFLRSTAVGSYHFVWEQHSTMNAFMKSLKYKEVACGNSVLSDNPCDWKIMGLSPLVAANQCLYVLINSEKLKKAL